MFRYAYEFDSKSQPIYTFKELFNLAREFLTPPAT